MCGAIYIEIFIAMLGVDLAAKLHCDALDLSDLRSHQIPRLATDHLDGSRPRQQQRVPQCAQQLPQPPAPLPPYQPMPQHQTSPAALMRQPKFQHPTRGSASSRSEIRRDQSARWLWVRFLRLELYFLATSGHGTRVVRFFVYRECQDRRPRSILIRYSEALCH